MDFPDVGGVIQYRPEPMDSRLQERLNAIDRQIEVLKVCELKFLQLKAHEDVLFAKLFNTSGLGSVEQRKQNAYENPTWKDFADGLAVAEAEHLEQKRRYELALKAYDGAHLTVKNEAPAVRRQL